MSGRRRTRTEIVLVTAQGLLALTALVVFQVSLRNDTTGWYVAAGVAFVVWVLVGSYCLALVQARRRTEERRRERRGDGSTGR